jgi:carbonic anhydrase/acetyltransferase-like protein (isoleucine patch superfamily)
MQIRFLDFVPHLEAPFEMAPTAAAIGRTTVGAGLRMLGFATLRGDGESIRVGTNAHFAERACVHIADGMIPTVIGNDVTVGRYALVHACTLERGVVVADAAVVMDGARVGAHALIAPDSLVAPRKHLPGGWIYQGNPAMPVRRIAPAEVDALARTIRNGERAALTSSDDLPPLHMQPFLPPEPGEGVLRAFRGRVPSIGRAYVAPTAVVVGDVVLADDAGIYFGCAVTARDGRVVIGARTNIQDNSILATDRSRGDLILGEDVTVGHNVRMGSGTFADDALIGMGARVGDRVAVEEGGCIAAGAWVEAHTRVKAGWIWAGRPARAFREVKDAEREWFAHGVAAYVRYGAAYLSGSEAPARV